MRDIHCPKDIGFENTFSGEDCEKEQHYNNCYHCWSTALAKREAYKMAIKALEQEPCEDAISRQAVCNIVDAIRDCISVEGYWAILERMRKLPSVNPQKYEYHIDHTDCIWYGSDSGCPVTCSQYRDGWNDAMDYIFKNGKGYQPYRRDG